jgi:hypothetical protein
MDEKQKAALAYLEIVNRVTKKKSLKGLEKEILAYAKAVIHFGPAAMIEIGEIAEAVGGTGAHAPMPDVDTKRRPRVIWEFERLPGKNKRTPGPKNRWFAEWEGLKLEIRKVEESTVQFYGYIDGEQVVKQPAPLSAAQQAVAMRARDIVTARDS